MSEIISNRKYRRDGFVNVMTKYGTPQDSSTKYTYNPETFIDDMLLASIYESNGLFATIINVPADEAVKEGFTLGIDPDTEKYINKKMQNLDWEEKFSTAIRWARLFGGSIIIMMVDDGNELHEPLDMNRITKIEELRVYERPLVNPVAYSYAYGNYGISADKPALYNVSSRHGTFAVHESRCLVFKNGILPEYSINAKYRDWGIPEYMRIKKSLQQLDTSHGYAVRMLERMVQPVYKMSGLANMLATEVGEDVVLKRLEVIDLARGLLNTMIIDAEGEDYDFKTIPLSGIKEVLESLCNQLSSDSKIAQTKLFGRSPAGENSTGESDLENYYNMIETDIQKRMMLKPLLKTIDIVIREGVTTGNIGEIPEYELEFVPLWSLSEQEQAQVDQIKAATEQTKAATAQMYIDMQALDPTEIRKALAKSEAFEIDTILDDMTDDELWDMYESSIPEEEAENQDSQRTIKHLGKITESGDLRKYRNQDESKKEHNDPHATSAAIIVIKDGMILTAKRRDNNQICGAGGSREREETTEQAARRELDEEFGITANEIYPLGLIEGLPTEYGKPFVYLCDSYSGEPEADGFEMTDEEFRDIGTLRQMKLFKPFEASLDLLESVLSDGHE